MTSKAKVITTDWIVLQGQTDQWNRMEKNYWPPRARRNDNSDNLTITGKSKPFYVSEPQFIDF